jgi:hypothetical protein
MAGHTTTAAAKVATKRRVYSLPEPINPQATLPRRQQESQNWRAGCVGQEASVASEHQALAVVGVVLVGIAITEHPLPLLQDSPSITAASTVGAEWDHSASPSHPAKRKYRNWL